MGNSRQLKGLPRTLYARCCCSDSRNLGGASNGFKDTSPRKRQAEPTLKELANAPDVKAILEHWWEFVPKTWLCTINQYIYSVLHEMLWEVLMKDFGLPTESVSLAEKEQSWREDCCQQPSMTRTLFYRMLLLATKICFELKAIQLDQESAVEFLRTKLNQVKEIESKRLVLGVHKYAGPFDEALLVEAEGLSKSLLRPSNRRQFSSPRSSTPDGIRRAVGHKLRYLDCSESMPSRAGDGEVDEALGDEVDPISSDGEDRDSSADVLFQTEAENNCTTEDPHLSKKEKEMRIAIPYHACMEACQSQKDELQNADTRSPFEQSVNESSAAENMKGSNHNSIIQERLSSKPKVPYLRRSSVDIPSASNRSETPPFVQARVSTGAISLKSNLAKKIGGAHAACPNQLYLGGCESKQAQTGQILAPRPPRRWGLNDLDISPRMHSPSSGFNMNVLPQYDTRVSDRQENDTDEERHKQRARVVTLDASFLMQQSDEGSQQQRGSPRPSQLQCAGACSQESQTVEPKCSESESNIDAEQGAQAMHRSDLTKVGEILRSKLRRSLELTSTDVSEYIHHVKEDTRRCAAQCGITISTLKNPVIGSPDLLNCSSTSAAGQRIVLPEYDPHIRRANLLKNPRMRGPYLASHRSVSQSCPSSSPLTRLPDINQLTAVLDDFARPPSNEAGKDKLDNMRRPSSPTTRNRPVQTSESPVISEEDGSTATQQSHVTDRKSPMECCCDGKAYNEDPHVLPQILRKQSSGSFGSALSAIANNSREGPVTVAQTTAATGGSAVAKHLLSTHSGLHTPFIALRRGPMFKMQKASKKNQRKSLSRGISESEGSTKCQSGTRPRRDFLLAHGVQYGGSGGSDVMCGPYSRHHKIRESYEAALRQLP